MTDHCAAVEDPNTMWTFCPSVQPAYVMAILFGITTLAHLIQAILHKKTYCWVITMSGLWQTVNYVLRILSIKNPTNYPYYAGWFILILVSPLWTNAFVYMVVGRMTWNFTDNARVLGVKAWRFGLYFVILDIIAFIIQVGGASMASGNKVPDSQILTGLHIYMGGVGAQQAFILLFCFFAYSLHRTMLREGNKPRPAYHLLFTIYVVLIFITIRIIFRLCEYSQGLNSTIPDHEAFQYSLDSLPMLLASIAFNIVHPGRVMPGKESDMPSRKQRKREGKGKKSDLYPEFMALDSRPPSSQV